MLFRSDGSIILVQNSSQDLCAKIEVNSNVGSSEIFSILSLGRHDLLASTGSGGMTLWKGNRDFSKVPQTDQIFWKKSSLISSIAYLPIDGAFILATFLGDYKYYPSRSEALRRACETIGQIDAVPGRSDREFEREANEACRK